MDKDASFYPPILYAPSTDEINGFALSTTKKLVERIGIYFPEKVEKQKAKKQNEQKLKVMLLSLRRKWKDGDQQGNHIKVH